MFKLTELGLTWISDHDGTVIDLYFHITKGVLLSKENTEANRIDNETPHMSMSHVLKLLKGKAITNSLVCLKLFCSRPFILF